MSNTTHSRTLSAADHEEEATRLLAETFGFPAFRHGQWEVVRRLLQGRSVLSIFPTGGGKSLCYQLPALMLEGLTLVISPLIALMKDQLDFLSSRGVQAARLDSTQDAEEYRRILQALSAGRIKLLYISPERFGNERFLQTLKRLRLSMLAVDEAHCISEWGHNFRPDYLKIASLARNLAIPRVLALTATATPPVARDIAAAFSIHGEDIVQTGFYRPNLQLAVWPVRNEKRENLLLQRLRSVPPGPAIVYVTLQRTAESVAEFLRANDIKAMPYHAGLEPPVRSRIQDAFMTSEEVVVVATIAFGMGVDKADIRTIIHYNLPKGLESYVQEIGRAGRDGQTSVCELLASSADVITLENFTYGDTPTEEAISSLLKELLDGEECFDLSMTELSERHDMRPLVVSTLLTYLELMGILQATGPYYALFKFQPLHPSEVILSRYSGERAQFLRQLFRQARKGRTWFSLDAHQAGRAIGQPRERIVAALNYLDQQGDLTVQAQGVREGYRLLSQPQNREALRLALCSRFAKREELEIERIRAVLNYVQHTDCRTQFLLDYFGEGRGACGHCDYCLKRNRVRLPPAVSPGFSAEDIRKVAALRGENQAALATPRQMARFLCGMASPATTRARLRGHARFGEWSGISFRFVLSFVEAHW
ncbi:MAG: RecQ family ATP-dependent DNA helicase [Magnetococcales bacterium]|nr:RecQ family ATP-dependent DNA helicase [Magnetococcales bacterium]